VIFFMEDGSLATVARDIDLPLFLYNRETGDDLLNILKECYFIEGKIGW